MKTFAFSVVAAALALGASARTFEVVAWRGETVAARVPDFAELSPSPGGIDVRYGVLKSVKYAPTPGSLQRLEVYDRVKWDSDDDGPRVVEVRVPADAKPGVYDCGMMRVKVVDRVLPPPKEWKYYLDLWQHPWAVARIAKAKPFSKKHYEAMRPVYELLATAGQKTVTVPIVDQPWDHQCADAYHSMIEDPDYRLFDEYVEFCLGCGLGPDISCYSLCPWSLGLRLPAIEMRIPGAWRCTNAATLATSSGLRSSIAMRVRSNHPFAFTCATNLSNDAPQRLSSSSATMV